MSTPVTAAPRPEARDRPESRPPRTGRPRWRPHWPRWEAPVRRRIGAVIASGLLLSTAFPGPDLGPLALVALIPLLWAWRDATPRRAALYGFFFGLAFFGVLLSWIWYFGAVAYLPLILAGGAYIAAPGALVAGLARFGVRSPWLTAAAWVLFEQLRGRFPFGGLPWGETGAALHDFPVARSLASWGGVALVSFLVVAVNALLVDAFMDTRVHSWQPLSFAGAGLAAVALVVGLGHGFRYEPTETGRLRIATIQGNDQNRDIVDPIEFEAVVVEQHFALAQQLDGRYDLIVFPESSLNRNPEQDAAIRKRITDIGAAHGAAMLVNALLPAPDGRDYNTNLLFEPDGDLQGTYAKQHLVPFGEYVPLRRYLDFWGILDRIPYDYAPGQGRELFEVADHRVGTIICFESAFGPLVREFVRDGAEIIVVTTNNRSYRRSANSAQHIALGQMRAAEVGRPVVQASISGISGRIDARGDVRQTTELFENEVVTSEVITTTGQTPYVRYGDWVIWGSGVALVGAALYGRSRWVHPSASSQRGRRRMGA
jgi:apolipoprotein N-acyltransferase